MATAVMKSSQCVMGSAREHNLNVYGERVLFDLCRSSDMEHK